MSQPLGFIIRKRLLTVFLTFKALLAGFVLAVSNALLVVQSAFKYAFAAVMGIKKTPEVVMWNGFPSVLSVPAKANLDFDFWRKPTYILPTLKALVSNKTKKLLLEKRVEIIPDETLFDWIANGALSRLAVFDGDNITVDLSLITDIEPDSGAYFTGPIITVNKYKHNEVKIAFTNGETYGPQDGAFWSLSKLHVQACASFLLPGSFHGNIHFGLPCVAAASLYTLDKHSPLYQLLAPHLRFTLRINNEALRVQRAQDRSKPYAPFPLTGEAFVESIASDIKRQLMEPGFRCPPWSLHNDELPFNQYGKAYYQVVRSFVERVLIKCSKQELKDWKLFMHSYIPNFEQKNTVDAVATIIWQVSFLHSADHYGLDKLMQAERYMFYKIQLPEPALSGIDKETSDEQVIRRACLTDDRFRSNIFNATFARGHKHLLWSNSMDNIRYKFKDEALQGSAKDFQKELLATQETLIEQDMNICPLSNVFQSICW